MKIEFSPPFINQSVIDEVLDTLKSGWITTGPKVKKLEEEVVKLTGCQESLCVNSWTSGAILVLKWFGVGPGDEVIIPAYTYSATALSVLHCGATPVMVDVLEDFTIDPEKVRLAITKRTKVIMPVDIAGLMCDYRSIHSLVQDPTLSKLFIPSSEKQKELGRILVLADAAHSIGASFNGIKSGCAGDITIFSFHAVKNITTAEGGAICLQLPKQFNPKEEYKLMRLWSLNGQTKDAFTKSKAGGWRYDILFQGLKVNMPDICAAIGLAQIRNYNDILLMERKRVANFYSNFFKNKEWAQCPTLQDSNRISCYHLYALRIKNINEETRDKMIEHITAEDITVNVHFIPMPMLTVFKNMGFDIKNFPVSFDNYSREISLPIYPQLLDEHLERICSSVEKAFNKLV